MRLIDADALPVHKEYCVDEAGWGANFYVVDKDDIDKAPTIDPETLRPKGRWEKVIPSKSAAKWSTKMSCSVCHRLGYRRSKYCPNCGAKMEGEGMKTLIENMRRAHSCVTFNDNCRLCDEPNPRSCRATQELIKRAADLLEKYAKVGLTPEEVEELKFRMEGLDK